MLSIGGGGDGEDYLEKERRRIERRRLQNEERAKRFLDPRARIMGVDCGALEEQMREKEREREDRAREEAEEEVRRQALACTLAEMEAEERRIRQLEASALRAEWQRGAAMEQERRKKEKEERLGGNDKERAGPSSLLSMHGHDLHKQDRVKAQHSQMMQWAKEQHIEKQKKVAQEKEAAEEWDAYTKEVAAFQRGVEDEKTHLRQMIRQEVRTSNKELEERRQREREEKKRAEREAEAQELAAREESLTEIKGRTRAYNPQVGHMMKDRYKGMTNREVAQLLSENEAIHAAKLEKEKKERHEEEEWNYQRETVRRAIDAREQHIAALRRAEQDRIRMELLEQKAKHKRDEILSHSQQFGEISPAEGLFAGFGRSCR